MPNADIQSWVQLARIASPIVALLGLLFIWLQLNSNARQHKREKTFVFTDKYYNPTYVRIFLNAKKFITDPSSTFEAFQDDPIVRRNVGICLNYFVELSELWSLNLVERDIVDDLLGNASIETYDKCTWIIEEVRNKQKQEDPCIPQENLYFYDWEAMNNDILNIRQEGTNETERIAYLKKIMPFATFTK